ncbi:MAG: PD-(D/E)XK nuclease family protein [Candidatus Hydrogenedentota bacterium]|nr:MAG: PD-(D/E)XK nuclease family protein [Candidatus Hydrogenedentota bacterium]
MPIIRHFLGWDTPFLTQVADFLLKTEFRESGASNRFRSHPHDLSSLFVVTPGRRFRRRLLELLTEKASSDWIPPRFAGLGDLLDRATSADKNAASDTLALLCRLAALRRMERDTLAPLFPYPPERDDLAGWYSLARDLATLDAELAAAGLTVEDVLAKISETSNERRTAQWKTVCRIRNVYLALLEKNGLRDRHQLRIEAIEKGRCAIHGTLLLAGTVDAPPLVSRLLRVLAETRPVHVLLPAPESEKDRFDDTGRFLPAKWESAIPPYEKIAIETVGSPAEQAYAVIRTIAEKENFSCERLTVGVGDEALVPEVQRRLCVHNLRGHWAGGLPISRTSPFRLLAALREFAARPRLSSLLPLLRHPVFEDFVRRKIEVPSVLVPLERFLQETLLTGTPDSWPENEATAAVQKILPRAKDILPSDCSQEEPLSERMKAIAEMLRRLYEEKSFHRYGPAALEAASLESLASRIKTVAALPENLSRNLATTLDEALGLLSASFEGESLPEPSASQEVEILGWLEVPYDDADEIIVLGFNEGSIPSAPPSQPLLPDSLRTRLGLPDRRHRFARDLLYLTLLAHGHKLRLVSGRFDREGNPLLPSRLLLRGSAEKKAERILQFFHRDADTTAPPLIDHQERNSWTIPLPIKTLALKKISMTDFRTFLACPYRFYLAKLLPEPIAPEDPRELDSRLFGTVLHSVLAKFGSEKTKRDSTNAEEIEEFLVSALEKEMTKRFSAARSPAIRIQQEVIRKRLASFAAFQAEQVRLGWRISQVEMDCSLRFPAFPSLPLVGRIDRVDLGPDGEVRILDYKAFEKKENVERCHKRNDEWIDLQLPLYRAAYLEKTKNDGKDLSVGFVCLTKEGTYLSTAQNWNNESYVSALEVAQECIKKILDRAFWPPGTPPYRDDPYRNICLENYPFRSEILERLRNEGSSME